LADDGVYLHIGPKIGEASTRIFTGQVIAVSMMARAATDAKTAMYQSEPSVRGYKS
jgi:glucosamine 6-phosphate synthetase-like amidotransferase/phosphosugar isomerase protein